MGRQYTNAFPILREIGVPATIFLASRFIGGTRRLWQERLWYVLQCVSETQLQSFAREWRAGTESKLAPVNLDFAKWRSFQIRCRRLHRPGRFKKRHVAAAANFHGRFCAWPRQRLLPKQCGCLSRSKGCSARVHREVRVS